MSRLKIALLVLTAGASASFAQSLDQSRAFANELYADSSARVSGLDQGNKVFAPKVGGIITTRYNFNQRDNVPPSSAGNSSTTTGFQMAYAKLTVAGNVIDESWSYGIQIKFNEFDGMSVLDDMWVALKIEDQWSIKWGQFKLPILREENISDGKQLSANRSVTNSVFTQSRSQGVLVSYSGSDWRAMFGFTDGLGSRNTDYTATAEADYAFTGRGEFKWAGDWKQYDEFTSFREGAYFGAVGAAAHYQAGGHTVNTTNSRTFEATADVMIKGNGWNAYAAAIYRAIDPSGTAIRTDDMGFLAQAGMFVSPVWELFGRYDVVIPDEDRTNSDTFTTLTFGANRYFIPNSHAAKFTVDVLWFLDEQSAGIVGASTLTGVLASTNANQFAVQAQFQLLF